MDIQQIFDTLHDRGATVTARDGRLQIDPPEAMDAGLRTAMIEHKDALLQVLAAGPPEPAPTHPSWRTPATWNAEHGVWQRCGGMVPTEATRENVHRYLRRRKGD